MKIRYIKAFYGRQDIEEAVNEWVRANGYIIISISPVIPPSGSSTYFVVLYEEGE